MGTSHPVAFGELIRSVVKTVPKNGQQWHYAELESVKELWENRYGTSYLSYRWFQAILTECQRRDIEPLALIKRFPKGTPRHGWWAMLNYFRSHFKPLEVGEESFEAWRGNLNL